MKVVVGGGSGYIGRALAASLESDGNQVVLLSRRPGPGTATWDDAATHVDGAGAVVNLAGVTIGGHRWTRQRKEAILASRVETTRTLVEAIEAASVKPSVLVTASGIDYFGNSGDAIVDEGSPAGDTFLARVCVAWEAAGALAPVRHVAIRTSLVVGPGADAVRLMALPFRLFAGGPVGGGGQWFPWIALDDVVRLYRLAIDDGSLGGPVNAVAPEQIRQRDAAKELGRALHRPSIVPTPAAAVRLLLGEQADLLLGGQRAVSSKLDAFEFGYRDLRAALEHALR
jgi:uncharacterized protein (TIGR01777 family)